MTEFRDIVEQDIYVPYSEEVLASVWAVDPGLQLFSNVPEDLACDNAADFPGHIYFFAELIMGEPGVEIYDAYHAEVSSHHGEVADGSSEAADAPTEG